MINLIYCCSKKVCTCDGFCNFLPIYFSDFIVRKLHEILFKIFKLCTLVFLDFTYVIKGLRDEVEILKGHRTHGIYDKNS
jgi:hypothetical protein